MRQRTLGTGLDHLPALGIIVRLLPASALADRRRRQASRDIAQIPMRGRARGGRPPRGWASARSIARPATVYRGENSEVSTRQLKLAAARRSIGDTHFVPSVKIFGTGPTAARIIEVRIGWQCQRRARRLRPAKSAFALPSMSAAIEVGIRGHFNRCASLAVLYEPAFAFPIIPVTCEEAVRGNLDG